MNTAPKVKIEMIELSVLCFLLGVLGLFPVFGIPAALVALRHHGRVLQIRDGHWNPAHHYLYWGAVCARLAVILLALELTAAAAVYTIEYK